MDKPFYPEIKYFNHDFVDIYERTWNMIDASAKNADPNSFNFMHPSCLIKKELKLEELCLQTFYLVYSNEKYSNDFFIDKIYELQESNGALRASYDSETFKPIVRPGNEEGIIPPLLAYTEYNIYHKTANKKRLKDNLNVLQLHSSWLESFKDEETKLFKTSAEATFYPMQSRSKARFLIDFNLCMLINFYYLYKIGEILNEKEFTMTYKKAYTSLKISINKYMWNEQDSFFYDLDENKNQIKVQTILSFLAFLIEFSSLSQQRKMFAHLKNPKKFGTYHPFPLLSQDFPEEVNSLQKEMVSPLINFLVIKALEKQDEYIFAREVALKHVLSVLDVWLSPDVSIQKNFWSYYSASSSSIPKDAAGQFVSENENIGIVALATISLMVENIIGLDIMLSKKTVDWIVPNLEFMMGIKNLSLKRNFITILSHKKQRGWEIRLESEKLYYFTIRIIKDNKKKILPIPAGRCSILLEKL